MPRYLAVAGKKASPHTAPGEMRKQAVCRAISVSHNCPPSSIGRAQGPQPCGRGFEPHGGCLHAVPLRVNRGPFQISKSCSVLSLAHLTVMCGFPASVGLDSSTVPRHSADFIVDLYRLSAAARFALARKKPQLTLFPNQQQKLPPPDIEHKSSA